MLKFIYSEKATKFCEIFNFLLSYVVPVKSEVKISQNFVASEYMNFKHPTFGKYRSKIWAIIWISIIACPPRNLDLPTSLGYYCSKYVGNTAINLCGIICHTPWKQRCSEGVPNPIKPTFLITYLLDARAGPISPGQIRINKMSSRTLFHRTLFFR